MSRPAPHNLSDYPYHLPIPTRWSDNDVYGHINNAVYYFYFDTVVNRYLLDNGLLMLGQSKTIGLVVDTGCAYFAPMAFPDEITAGLRVAKLGASSVRYEIALFKGSNTKTSTKASAQASAQGHFVHVYVDAKTRRPVPIYDKMRRKLMEITA